MASSQTGSARTHAAKHAGAASAPSLRSSTSAYYHRALKALGLCQTLALVAFAVFQQQRAAPAAPVAPEQPPVEVHRPHVLTDDSLPSFVATMSNGTLLNFHSTACSHCRQLAPEFEAAAKELQAAGSAPLAFVDVSTAPKAAERYGVFRYPTMLWFRHGEAVLELPPTVRQADKIVDYVRWASQPAVVAFESRAELEDSLPQLREALGASSPPLVCGFGSRFGARAALEASAERLRGKTIFVFTEEAQDGDPALRAYYADASLDQDFMGKLDQEAAHTWVKGLVKKSKAKRSA
mmetsp:Transcript_26864/g.72884  ORF Transcript_26864/g.72884 Transcript_26864/m.72884 type:complete len:294 (-) Transcript_26864:165-1046(-)|eukprot:CAMPEP_0171264366 /NCGR_PEP_ID=MMETSP0790-20130122/57576_1 /TAXON_ID=2925 /ORGANISM="Alexandrium catenella, Strain OF101" /LENGTH=293 /DNA_ID=CAMNT_0011733009 /DNA_START=81 /DNA_END=962 /DNA_ORIENTATION=-